MKDFRTAVAATDETLDKLAADSVDGNQELGNTLKELTDPKGRAAQVTTTSHEARPATELDLGKLDESMLLDLPMIQAKSFDVPALLQVEPKDPAIRFRWVNFKNDEGGNYQKFKAVGFTNATLDDIKKDIGDNLVKEDGTIKFYDVVLMKIGVILLMQAYKKNITQSMQRVGQWDKTAQEEAKRTFMGSCRPDMLDAMKRAGLNVEFYSPSMQEMVGQDKDFNK